MMDLVGIGAGVKCICDRKEDEIWLGEKPRTTLWQLINSALVSDPALFACRLLSGLLMESLEDDESEQFRGAWTGDAGRGVMFVEGKYVGTTSVIEGDSGSRSFFSLIDMTIFSSPNDVICFSLPLPRLSIELS